LSTAGRRRTASVRGGKMVSTRNMPAGSPPRRSAQFSLRSKRSRLARAADGRFLACVVNLPPRRAALFQILVALDAPAKTQSSHGPRTFRTA
jgi:hypothetical protein